MDVRRVAAFVNAYRRIGRLLGVSRESSLIDIGCGCGELAQALARDAAFVCGIDVCLESLVVARKRNAGGVFAQGDARALPVRRLFDAATAVSSLEFCHDKIGVLAEIHEVLKDGGLFYVEVRNADFLLYRLPTPLRRICERMRLLLTYPAEGFQDLKYAEWRELLGRAGFSVVRVTRSYRPAWYGDVLTRCKNMLIRTISYIAPLRTHYMIGFLCIRKSGEK